MSIFVILLISGQSNSIRQCLLENNRLDLNTMFNKARLFKKKLRKVLILITLFIKHLLIRLQLEKSPIPLHVYAGTVQSITS